MIKKLFVIITLILLGENIFLLAPKIINIILQKENTQIVRGWRKAEKLGCFSCHGPRGFGETPNPQSKDKDIPSFKSGEPAMYAKNDKQLSEYILYGSKKKKKSKKTKIKNKEIVAPKKENKIPVFGEIDETKYEDEKQKGIIKMPAFKKWVTSQDVKDLIVFIKANAILINPKKEEEKKGRDLVLNNGCFACHGPLGAGGVENPGSFKGYIPSFIGNDFKELVKNKSEFIQWIKEGKINRFEKNPLAKFFTSRQVIKMPSFKKVLTGNDIDLIIIYLKWLRKEEKKYN